MRVLNKDDVGEYGLVWAITVVNAVSSPAKEDDVNLTQSVRR